MNDAWYVCALLMVAFQPQWWWLAGALLVGPWIDERFLFGLPGALFIRAQMLPANKPSRALAGAAAAVGLYLALRLSNALGLPQANLDGYLRYATHNSYRWMPWATLGWFMGQRAVWIFTLYPAVEGFQRNRLRGVGLAALVIAPLGAISLLAADTGRAPSLLLPLAFYGLHRASLVWESDRLKQFATVLLAVNLMLPAMHVTYQNLDVINMLPVEIARWLIRS